jgi:hypothetical protein
LVTLIAAGGLGNQLFQYGVARRLAKSHGVELVIDTRFYSPEDAGGPHGFWLDQLPIRARIIRYPEKGPMSAHVLWRRGYRRLLESRLRPVFLEREPGFDDRVLALPANAQLTGYFQSYRYLVPRDEEILAELDLSTFLQPQHAAYLQYIRERELISVHVRRNDYVGNPNFELADFDSYLCKSMTLMRSKVQRPNFLIFSDDLAWCRRHPAFQTGCEFYTPPPDLPDGGSLYLMSQCAHHILANSSFSFWAAWLNASDDKMVIAPKAWIHGRLSSQMQIIPPYWVSL